MLFLSLRMNIFWIVFHFFFCNRTPCITNTWILMEIWRKKNPTENKNIFINSSFSQPKIFSAFALFSISNWFCYTILGIRSTSMIVKLCIFYRVYKRYYSYSYDSAITFFVGEVWEEKKALTQSTTTSSFFCLCSSKHFSHFVTKHFWSIKHAIQLYADLNKQKSLYVCSLFTHINAFGKDLTPKSLFSANVKVNAYVNWQLEYA